MLSTEFLISKCVCVFSSTFVFSVQCFRNNFRPPISKKKKKKCLAALLYEIPWSIFQNELIIIRWVMAFLMCTFKCAAKDCCVCFIKCATKCWNTEWKVTKKPRCQIIFHLAFFPSMLFNNWTNAPKKKMKHTLTQVGTFSFYNHFC